MEEREIKLAKIELRIKEVEEDRGFGKVVIFIKDGEIKEWQVIKTDQLKEE